MLVLMHCVQKKAHRRHALAERNREGDVDVVVDNLVLNCFGSWQVVAAWEEQGNNRKIALLDGEGALPDRMAAGLVEEMTGEPVYVPPPGQSRPTAQFMTFPRSVCPCFYSAFLSDGGVFPSSVLGGQQATRWACLSCSISLRTRRLRHQHRPLLQPEKSSWSSLHRTHTHTHTHTQSHPPAASCVFVSTRSPQPAAAPPQPERPVLGGRNVHGLRHPVPLDPGPTPDPAHLPAVPFPRVGGQHLQEQYRWAERRRRRRTCYGGGRWECERGARRGRGR